MNTLQNLCSGTVEENQHLGQGQHLNLGVVTGCHVIVDPVLTGDASENITGINSGYATVTPTIGDYAHLGIGYIHAGVE